MTAPQLHALFDDPPRDFGPTPLWWWSGATVTPERLAWQMARYDEGGIHNLVVINLAPAGPLFGAVADDPPWFSETWWERFEQTCDIAAERNMKIWFYDQIGFSGANLQGRIANEHPDAAGRSLRFRDGVVDGGRVALAGNEELIGAYDAAGRRVEADVDGRIEGARDGAALRIVTAVPTAFDYLAPDAVALLLDLVHGEYERRVPERLGTVIPGSFQDEAPAANAWTPRFAEEFRERRGYDLLDHLPALFRGTSAEEKKVRGDAFAVRSALVEEAFFRPIGQWHADRGMLIGADQSNPARAGYPTQGTQLYTDYFRTHRWYGAVGSDHEGDAKVHSSMAHLYDHPRVWIESFHSSGWGGTLEDTYDWLMPFLRSGANLYNPHATYFGTAGGWFEWAPPSTDWRQPYWQQYPAFSRAVARIASIMSWGMYDAEVAVLHPTATAQAGLTLDLPVDHFGDGVLGGEAYAEVDAAQETYLSLVGSNNWFRTRTGALDRAGIAFDVIDDDSVVREPLDGSAIRVSAQRYRAVVLPAATVLEEATARRLVELLDAGGRVLVVGADPVMAAGLHGDDAAVVSLTAHPRLERCPDAEAAAGALGALAGHATSDVPLLVRRDGPYAVALVTGTFPSASGPRRTASTGSLWTDETFDPARYAHERVVRVRATVAEAEVLDPASGRRWTPRIEHDADGSTLRFDTGGSPGVLVAWTEGEPATPAPASTPQTRRSAVDAHGWTGELVPTLDNTWGDLALPLGTDVEALQVWSMDWQDGDAPWTHAKATYGDRARTLAPVPAAAAPAPISSDEVAEIVAGQRPLAPAEWGTAVWSPSRGIEKPGRGALGNKGLVPEEFIRVPAPAAGEVAVVRVLVESDLRGQAELIVGAGAEKTVWWNGEQVAHAAANTARALVDASRPVNVLEYRLGTGRNGRGVASEEEPLGSFFTLAERGGFGDRPEFMRVPDGMRPDGSVRYAAAIELPADAEHATLVVGAGVAVTVSIDGTTVARQAKVEYYESEWGPTPAYFLHDVTALLRQGAHRLVIEAESVRAEDVVFADLVAWTPAGVVTLVSGAGWAVQAGEATGTSAEHLGHWDEPASTHAALRPHPLPGVEWLRGAPVVGRAVPAFRATDHPIPAPQRFRFRVPAGTVELEVPLRIPGSARIDGRDVRLEGGSIRLPEPLAAPAIVELATEPTTFLRGGSAFAGPVRVRTDAAPVALGDWQELGLASWSGGVRYTTRITVPEEAATAWLDLGRVRGSVHVEVDGERVADLFCGPFRVDLGARRGELQLAITVNNTLAPFLHESTPTTWVFPSQLASGLFGPVVLETT